MSDTKPASVAQLTHLARLYLDIAMQRRGPEEVPAAPAVLALTLGAYLLLNLGLSLLLLKPDFLQAIGQQFLAIAFMLAWYRGVLRLAGRPERFLQTVSALFGYQAVLAPLVVVATTLFVRYSGQPSAQLPVSFLMLALVGWTFAVNARVLRAATEWPFITCIGTVILQTVIEAVVVLAVFGSPRQS